MKKITLFAATIMLLTMCNSEKLSYPPAREASENCLKAIDKGEYDKVIADYYSTDFGSVEPPEELKSRFQKLKDITGNITSIELKDSAMRAEVGEEAQVILTYRVTHERIVTTEKFTVSEQAGKYKITGHDIKND